MAKNYIQPGHAITVVAPTGGVISGAGVLIGTLFGIAQHDAVEGADLEILTEGVVEIGKTSALAIDAGDRLFWDATNKVVNKTSTAQQQVDLGDYLHHHIDWDIEPHGNVAPPLPSEEADVRDDVMLPGPEPAP